MQGSASLSAAHARALPGVWDRVSATMRDLSAREHSTTNVTVTLSHCSIGLAGCTGAGNGIIMGFSQKPA